MSKRHVEELLLVFLHLLEDAKDTYPELRGEFDRDIVRIRQLSQTRGLHCFAVDLPAVGKHFDQCLAVGQYSLSGLPLTKRYSNRVVIPKFLRGLYLLVFCEHGRLKEDADVSAICLIRQLCYLGKKAAIQCSSANVDREIKEFVELDEQLPDPSWVWDVPLDADLDIDEFGSFRSDAAKALSDASAIDDNISGSVLRGYLDEVVKLLCRTLGHYDRSVWRFRHGPGAISQKSGPVNKYQWYNWSERLEASFPIADCGFHNHCAWAEAADKGEIGDQEPFSRLIAVAKTLTKPRLIAAEPSEHQWCQQNIWHYFRTRTQRSWLGRFISFTDQSFNQSLALAGSRDGSLATIDLSSASDRVTPMVVGWTFRYQPELLLALQATRTRFVQLPNGTEHRLRKFSTMGSAATFPVESIVFLAFSLAVVLAKRRLPVTESGILSLIGQVSVFGDDIVVPSDCRVALQRSLELFWFKVNTTKSFSVGNFRESCGVDAFAGHDVTPAYWHDVTRQNPASILSKMEVRNNFYKKGYLHTADFLESTIPVALPPVPIGAGFSGLTTRLKPTYRPFKVRWNRDLQRFEAFVPTFCSRSERQKPGDDSGFLQFFTEDPNPTDEWKIGWNLRTDVRLRRSWVPLTQLGYELTEEESARVGSVTN